jgi:ANTAR domain-containing protein
VTEVQRGDQAAPEPVPEKLDYPPLTVIRRSSRGWRVDDEELPDLLSAIVLADLLAPELRGARPAANDSPVLAADGSPAPSPSVGGSPPDGDSSGADRSFPAAGDGPGAVADDASTEAARLRVTVSQLEHALATRVRVEQAIGIVSERRRVPARQAFELLRTVARADGTRLAELAARVVDSAVNPLLPLPEDLARPPRPPRVRGRSPRHMRASE